LGERNGGFKIAMNSLNVGELNLLLHVLDAQRRVLNAAVEYANVRVQFNTPISKFGAIRSKLAEMATSIYADEAASYRASKKY